MIAPARAMERSLSARAYAIALLLTAIFIWSATLVITKAALADLGPFTILLARFALGFACLAPFARRAGFRLGFVVRREMVLLGLTGMILNIGLETVGLQFTSAATAALIIAGIPAATAVASFFALGERPGRAQLAGIALAVVGVLLVTQARPEGGGARALIGNMMVLGAVAAWAIYTVQGKKLAGRYTPMAATTAAMGATVLMAAPLAAFEWATNGVPQVTLMGAGSILYLGVLASAVAFGLWNRALRELSASVAAPYVNLVPVLGLAFAIAAGEPASAIQLVGGVIVGLGVWLGSTQRLFARRAVMHQIAPDLRDVSRRVA